MLSISVVIPTEPERMRRRPRNLLLLAMRIVADGRADSSPTAIASARNDKASPCHLVGDQCFLLALSFRPSRSVCDGDRGICSSWLCASLRTGEQIPPLPLSLRLGMTRQVLVTWWEINAFY